VQQDLKIQSEIINREALGLVVLGEAAGNTENKQTSKDFSLKLFGLPLIGVGIPGSKK
jgi:hypothetical protein